MPLSLLYFLCPPWRSADFPWWFSWNTPQWRSVWEQQAAAAREVFRGGSAGPECFQVSPKSHCLMRASCTRWQVLGKADASLFIRGKQMNQCERRWEWPWSRSLVLCLITCQSGFQSQRSSGDSAGPATVATNFVLPSSLLLVLSAPAAAFYFIFWHVMQNLFILPMFGADGLSSKLGPVCFVLPWRYKEKDRGA